MESQVKKYLLVISLLLSICFPQISLAQAQQELAICLTVSLTGRERKQLAQWVFFGMAVHPDLSSYTSISTSARDESNKFIAELLTRLITEDCPTESERAIDEGGTLAMQGAFEVVGAVAMQELMTDQNIAIALAEFEKYMDESMFKATGQ